jgi:CheY-like chemotaxis protein
MQPIGDTLPENDPPFRGTRYAGAACTSGIVTGRTDYIAGGKIGDKSVQVTTVPRLRVLVVEDDAVIGVLLAEMLEGMGHDVCAVEATEVEAVTAAAHWNPDLMIVDVRLGEGSGVTAIDEIHRTRPVPHVFVSADISRLQILRPDTPMLQKPYRESDLAHVIQRALDADVVFRA